MKRVKITDRDRELEAEVRSNGGTATASEFAHSREYEYVGISSGPLTPELRDWLGDGYRASDGSLYRRRQKSGARMVP